MWVLYILYATFGLCVNMSQVCIKCLGITSYFRIQIWYHLRNHVLFSLFIFATYMLDISTYIL